MEVARRGRVSDTQRERSAVVAIRAPGPSETYELVPPGDGGWRGGQGGEGAQTQESGLCPRIGCHSQWRRGPRLFETAEWNDRITYDVSGFRCFLYCIVGSRMFRYVVVIRVFLVFVWWWCVFDVELLILLYKMGNLGRCNIKTYRS